MEAIALIAVALFALYAFRGGAPAAANAGLSSSAGKPRSVARPTAPTAPMPGYRTFAPTAPSRPTTIESVAPATPAVGLAHVQPSIGSIAAAAVAATATPMKLENVAPKPTPITPAIYAARGGAASGIRSDF